MFIKWANLFSKTDNKFSSSSAELFLCNEASIFQKGENVHWVRILFSELKKLSRYGKFLFNNDKTFYLTFFTLFNKLEVL